MRTEVWTFPEWEVCCKKCGRLRRKCGRSRGALEDIVPPHAKPCIQCPEIAQGP
eukprot:gene1681-4894_t